MKPMIRLFVLALAVCLSAGCSPPASHAAGVQARSNARMCGLPTPVCPCEGGRGIQNARTLARAAAVTVKAIGIAVRVTAQAIDPARDMPPTR